MRPGGGKNKGGAFEREVAVLLSRWVTEGKRDDIFWRSAGSGSRATVAKARGKSLANQVGDISCIDPAGHDLISKFAIECKFYADLNYTGLIKGTGKLLDFWIEIFTQADMVHKNPMLFARQNRFPTMVCVSRDGADWLGLDEDLFCLSSPWNNIYMMEAGAFFVLTYRGFAPNRQRKGLIPL